MEISLPLLKEKFDAFNRAIFQGCLPRIEIKLSRARKKAGSFNYKVSNILITRNAKCSNLSISISVCFNYTEQELEDVLIHEMIHYYIHYKQLPDSGPHGPTFKRIMNDINHRFNRHIKVSFRSGELSVDAQRPRRLVHILAVISFKDGTKGLKVLTRVAPKIIAYYNSISRLPKVQKIELYGSTNVFFDSYPHSCSLRYHPIKETDLLPHLEKDVIRIMCDGKTLKTI